MLNSLFKFILLFSLAVPYVSCSKSDSKQADPGETDSYIFTNEKAVTNSVVDSALLAPDFSYPAMNGEGFKLSDHRGTVIVLNLWGTWCGPCIREIPDLIAIQNKFKKKNLEIVGVSLDTKGWKVVRPFAKKHKINYRILLDKQGTILKKYPLMGLPDTYIINKQGEIAHYIKRGLPTEKMLTPLLEKLTKR